MTSETEHVCCISIVFCGFSVVFPPCQTLLASLPKWANGTQWRKISGNREASHFRVCRKRKSNHVEPYKSLNLDGGCWRSRHGWHCSHYCIGSRWQLGCGHHVCYSRHCGRGSGFHRRCGRLEWGCCHILWHGSCRVDCGWWYGNRCHHHRRCARCRCSRHRIRSGQAV